MQDDFFFRRELEELESKAKEGRGFLADSIGATDEGEFDGAIAEGGGIMRSRTAFSKRRRGF
jgi:hypothetical protein